MSRRSLGRPGLIHGRPAAGCFTKCLAKGWLRLTMDGARRGVLPGMVRNGATFAAAAALSLPIDGRRVAARLRESFGAAPAGAQGAVIGFIQDGTVTEVEIMKPDLALMDRIV